MKINPIARNPVLVAALVPIIVWVGGYFGLHIDPKVASEAAAAVLVLGAFFARQLVRPTVKDEDPPDTSLLQVIVRQVLAELDQQKGGTAGPPGHVRVTGPQPGAGSGTAPGAPGFSPGLVTGGAPDLLSALRRQERKSPPLA